MQLATAKRLAPFLYYVPAVLVVFFKIIVPHYFFLLMILPYYFVAFYLIRKTPAEEKSNVDYFRLVFLTIVHLTLYTLMFWR